MKNIVMVMDREGSVFTFLQEKFVRIKWYIFQPSNKEHIKDSMFEEALCEAEVSSWQLLKSVVANFLGNPWSAEY